MPGVIHFYPNPVTFQTPSPINHQDYWKMVLAQQSAPWCIQGALFCWKVNGNMFQS